MELGLKGKRALVCGASQGIGRACAEALSKEGCEVIGLARNEAKLRTVPGIQRVLVADLLDRVQLESLIKAELEERGPIHILVNNAGGPPGGPILGAREENFLQAFSQHLLANALLANLIVPGMQKANYGRIVNIISTSVKIPLPGLGVSNTVRGAVANWAKTLASEVAPFGITVNNVLPGATETERLETLVAQKAQKGKITIEAERERWIEQIPARRFGQPEEIAALVAFLASERAGYINGTAIAVDGGRTGSL